jgi:hypothetical protein
MMSKRLGRSPSVKKAEVKNLAGLSLQVIQGQMFMNTKSTGYGEDTGWKVVNRLSTFNFGPHKTSLNTDPENSDVQ